MSEKSSFSEKRDKDSGRSKSRKGQVDKGALQSDIEFGEAD